MYQTKKLASGKEVNIRPLTWEEYWQNSENASSKRMEAEKMDDPVGRLRLYRQVRENGLSLTVEDWEGLKATLTLPEVLELEKSINEISELPVQEGNS